MLKIFPITQQFLQEREAHSHIVLLLDPILGSCGSPGPTPNLVPSDHYLYMVQRMSKFCLVPEIMRLRRYDVIAPFIIRIDELNFTFQKSLWNGDRAVYSDLNSVDRGQFSRYIQSLFLLYNTLLSDFNRYCSGAAPIQQFSSRGKIKIFNFLVKNSPILKFKKRK